jgi:hypothetical protein
MQVTEAQVQRSLQALTMAPEPTRSDRSDVDPSATDGTSAAVPDGLVERLVGAPALRDDRLASARRRLARGDQPSADDLAGRMVGRLVCDRLR